jgi:hypothetical protein
MQYISKYLRMDLDNSSPLTDPVKWNADSRTTNRQVSYMLVSGLRAKQRASPLSRNDL